MKPYGFAVTFTCTTPGATLLAPATEERTIRRKGTEAAARRAAALTPGFVQVVTCIPIAQEEAPPPRQRTTPPPAIVPLAATIRVPSTPEDLDTVVDAVRAIKAAAAELAANARQRRELVESISDLLQRIERIAPTPPSVERPLQPAILADRCQRLKELFNQEELESWQITVDRVMEAFWHRLPH